MFYNEIYALYEKDISLQMLSESYSELMRHKSQENRINVIPGMTLFDFLSKIKEQ